MILREWRQPSKKLIFLALFVLFNVFVIQNRIGFKQSIKRKNLRTLNNALQDDKEAGTIKKTSSFIPRTIWDDMMNTATTKGRLPAPKTIINFVSFQQPIDFYSGLVLTTHCSCRKDKLDNFITQMQYWQGPASLALFISQEQELHELEEFLPKIENYNIAVHLRIELASRGGYPHNILRNVAIENSEGAYIVALDVDLIPNRGSYEELLSLLKMSDFQSEVEKGKLMVLPAIEIHPKDGESRATKDMLPESKVELQSMIDQNKAIPFHMNDYKPSYGPTDYDRWLEKNVKNPGTRSDTEENVPIYYDVAYKDKFEPYVLAYRHGLPRLWTRFRGYGNDKLSWFDELDRAGYTFGVLMNFYTIHLSHRNSGYNENEVKENFFRYSAFRKYLKNRYESSSPITIE